MLPAHADPDAPFVSMLDPATGTGTFLVRSGSLKPNGTSETRPRATASAARPRTSLAPPPGGCRPTPDGGIRGQPGLLHSRPPEGLSALPPRSATHPRFPSTSPTPSRRPRGRPAHLRRDDPDCRRGSPCQPRSSSSSYHRHRRQPAISREVGRPWRRRGQSTRSRRWPSLDAFSEPGHGRVEFNLHNLNVYFWRWACWKALDQHPGHRRHTFITTSRPTRQPRIRRACGDTSEARPVALVVDCTPEGHQPGAHPVVPPRSSSPSRS